MSTCSDIKTGKDRIFKKYLNAGYLRTFTYSVLNVFNAISAEQDQNYIKTTKLGLKLYQDYKVRQRWITKYNRFKHYKVRQSWITNYDRFWVTKCNKIF